MQIPEFKIRYKLHEYAQVSKTICEFIDVETGDVIVYGVCIFDKTRGSRFSPALGKMKSFSSAAKYLFDKFSELPEITIEDQVEPEFELHKTGQQMSEVRGADTLHNKV